MTSPDPEIDGGLPWIRGVDPAPGTRPGSRQDPAQEPTPKPPGSRGGSDPATNLGTDFTEEKPALEPTSRKRNPAEISLLEGKKGVRTPPITSCFYLFWWSFLLACL